jgi:hypothetical protein
MNNYAITMQSAPVPTDYPQVSAQTVVVGAILYAKLPLLWSGANDLTPTLGRRLRLPQYL